MKLRANQILASQSQRRSGRPPQTRQRAGVVTRAQSSEEPAIIPRFRLCNGLFAMALLPFSTFEEARAELPSNDPCAGQTNSGRGPR